MRASGGDAALPLSRFPVAPSMLENPAGMAAAIWSFWSRSMRARPLASMPAARCSRPSTPSTTGVSKPIKLRAGPSPIPANLLTPETSVPSAPPPSSDASSVLPLSCSCALPPTAFVSVDKSPVGCSVIALASCRAPPGLAARSVSPPSIAGTDALAAFCVATLSRPVADAILPISSGVRKRDTAVMILSVMRVDPLSWNATYSDTELGVFLAPCVAMTTAKNSAHPSASTSHHSATMGSVV